MGFGKSEDGVGEVAEDRIGDALSSAFVALPDGALASFRRDVRGSGNGQDGLTCARYECARVDGMYLPLLAGERALPLWREISTAREKGFGSSSGVVLAHHLVLFIPEGLEAPAEAIVIPDEAICGLLQPLSGSVGLSAGEVRVLKQVICGIDLAEAARVDGVSRETKRSQFKGVARKFACHSQVEVASLSLTRLLLAVRLQPAAGLSSGDGLFRQLVGRFLPEGRTLEIVADNGVRHRFIDVGPPDGRVVAMVHSQVLPDIRLEDVHVLRERGLRLLIPLRSGAMTGTVRELAPAQHVDHAVQGLELLRTHFCGERMDVLGCVSGVPYALAYARANPVRVRTLALVGCPAGAGTSASVAGRFRKGLYQLAADHWSILSRVLEFYGRRINRPETFRSLLVSHYRQSQSDLAVVEAEYGAPYHGERARRLFVSSIGSIKHDFLNQARLDWGQFPSGSFPILFLHGAQDPVHPVERVREISGRLPGAMMHSLPAAGQLLYHQHFEPMLSAYAAFLRDHSPA